MLSEKEKRDLDLEFGRAAHVRHDGEWHAVFRSVLDFALEAIRTSALINGGAVIACFAFLGSVYNSDKVSAVVSGLMAPSLIFAAGAALSGVASIAAYFAQFYALMDKSNVTFQFKHPYVTDPPSHRARIVSEVFRWAAIGLVVSSYVLLAIGVFKLKSVLWH